MNSEINGYPIVFMPDHPKAWKTGSWKGYVYEHHIVAYLKYGDSITEDDEIHHISMNRSDNRPENLIKLPKQSHIQYHVRLRALGLEELIIANAPKGHFVYKCKNCFDYILKDNSFCCEECKEEYKKLNKKDKPSKKELKKMIETMKMVEIANKFNVSHKIVKQWCEEYKIEIPNKR